MIEERIVRNALAAALETGGDYSELYMEDTEQNNVSMVDGKVEMHSIRAVPARACACSGAAKACMHILLTRGKRRLWLPRGQRQQRFLAQRNANRRRFW